MEPEAAVTAEEAHQPQAGFSLDRFLELTDATLWAWLHAVHRRGSLTVIDGLLEEVSSLAAWVRAEIGQDACGVEVCLDVLLDARDLVTQARGF
jgi:hypothetical protein